MALGGLCVLPIGVLDKDTTVSAITDAEPWQTFELSDVSHHQTWLHPLL